MQFDSFVHKLSLAKLDDNRRSEFLSEWGSIDIAEVVDNSIDSNPSVVLFCVVKNEFPRIIKFLEYYRSLGVSTFVFLDNDSADGTLQYLSEQPGVMLYRCKEMYSSIRRVVWLNYLLLLHGTDRWCIVVDSDEYVTYVGFEHHAINEVIAKAESNRFNRVLGCLVDMYPKGQLFNSSSDKFISDYIYFDYMGYCGRNTINGIKMNGGPRKRIFGCNICLTKYSLFYYSKNTFYSNSHHLIPPDLRHTSPIWFAIRHYKFVDSSDLEKIKIAIDNKNYFDESKEYSSYLNYINQHSSINFYNPEYSIKYIDSNSFIQLPFLTDLFS